MSERQFRLDKDTENMVKEGLRYIEKFPDLPFEEKAKILTGFLKERGVIAERSKTFGDVLVTTAQGWGVVVLFNDAARKGEGKAMW